MSTLIDRLTDTQRHELSQAMAQRGGLKKFSQRHGINFHSLRGGLSRTRGQALEPSRSDLEEQWDRTAALLLDELQRDGAEPHRRFDVGHTPKTINLVEKPLHLQLKKWAWASDFHAPVHSELWVERLARVGHALDVPTLVVGGDLFDFADISRHGSDQTVPDINETLRVGGEILRYLRQVFPQIIVLPGNHDRRVAKKLDRDLSWENVVRMAVGDMTGITTTNSDYLYVNDNPGWACGHPSFFSVQPTVGLRQVALYRKRHILGSHNHVQGVSKVNDEYICIDPGAMCDRMATSYYMRGNGISKLQEWSNGFVIIDNDVPQLFADRLVHWRDYE